MMRKIIFIISLMLTALAAGAAGKGGDAKVGKPLPAWSEGCLDIHAINSARGECSFIIMPDGTTLTIDAGEFSSEGKNYRNDIQRPDSLTRPTETYARYMRRFMPQNDTIDYFMLTHFHMDHMGQLEPEYVSDKDGGYILSGITNLYKLLPFAVIVDRAYPDYDGNKSLAMSNASLANYRKFIDHAVKNRGLKAESFKLGSDSQFAMKYAPASYPGFKISNICANGCVWDGNKVVDCYENGKRRENGASCGLLVQYGDFDYFTAGDISHSAGDNRVEGMNVEDMTARVIGRPIEAMKAHHHLSPKTLQQPMMDILQPDVIVTQSFYIREIQPDKDIIRRIADNNGSKMYFTNIDSSLTDADPELYKRCTSINGHVVIRVLPGGKEYYVYVLDDTDDSCRVKRIDGPFKSK